MSKLSLMTLAGAAAVAASSAIAIADPLTIDGVEISDAATYEAAQAEGKVVLYGTYPEGNAKRIHAAFTEDTGIAVEYIRAPTGTLFPRIQTEASAGQLEADFIDLTDLPLLEDLVDLDILDVAYKVRSFDKIPEVLHEAEGRWYTYIRPSYILAFNSAVLEGEPPTSWADLLKPEYKGKIGVPNIDVGGSALSVYTFMNEELGGDYLTGLAAQEPRIYPSLSPMVNDLVRGEVAISLTDAGFLLTQKATGAPVQEIFPTDGVPTFPIAGGIATTAAHPNAAKVFLDWMTSVPGSNAVAETGAYGINPDANPPGGAAFPAEDTVWNFGLEQWLDKRDEYIASWHTTFGTN